MAISRAAAGIRRLLALTDVRASLDDRVEMPSALVYVHWDFPRPVAGLEWDLTVRADPGTSVGEYLALFSGSVDGSPCYLGLQTDLFNPGSGTGAGKGLIFSTWSSFDAADTRLAPGGFRQLGTHEGRFVGIRSPYQWATGGYRVSLSRGEQDAGAGGSVLDWFDLFVQPTAPAGPGGGRPAPQGEREWMGAIRFRRRSPRRPARVDPGGVLFLEVYSHAQRWADLPRWDVDVMAYGGDARCPSGRTEYPRDAHGRQAPNADARYDATTDRVVVEAGAGVSRRAPPARWP